jgi:PEP-CTERM motif
MIKTIGNISLNGLFVALLALCSTASAHTTSVGSFNAGVVGSVTLVLGTYEHGSPLVQGSVSLIGGPTIPPSVTQSFTSVLLTKPVGLIDGVNNFYADSNPSTWGTLPSDSYNSPTDTTGIGPVVNWMGATFSGLTAGTYTYQISGMTAVNWNNINSFQSNWTGTLIIPGTSVNPIPEPETYAMLLAGLGLLGFVARRRKLKLAA